MDNNGRKHYTRSMAQAQELLSTTNVDNKLTGESPLSIIEHKPIKTDGQEGDNQGQTIHQQPNEILSLLQQLIIKQDLLLEENKQFKQEIATQQITIKNLSQAVKTIQEANIAGQHVSTIKSSIPSETPVSLEATSDVTKNGKSNLKELAAKQLQSKRIDQLLNYTPFSGSTSQEVSDWIDDFSNKCEQLQLDDTQRLSIAIDLLKGNAKLWYDTHKDIIDNWLTLKNKLTSYFKLVTGTDQFQLEQKLYNRRRQHNELAIDYCHNVLKLCSKVNQYMDDDTRLKHLIKGLNAAAQRHMDLKNPTTTEKFLEALIQYDKWQEEEKNHQRPSATFDHHRNIPTRTTQHQPMQHEQASMIPRQQHNYSSQQYQPYRAPPDIPQTRYNNNTTTTNNNNNERVYDGCWSCGGKDHYQYQCSKNY